MGFQKLHLESFIGDSSNEKSSLNITIEGSLPDPFPVRSTVNNRLTIAVTSSSTALIFDSGSGRGGKPLLAYSPWRVDGTVAG